MIYFDNSATGGYKPARVTESVFNTIRYANANATRSSHRLSRNGVRIIANARDELSNYFNNGVAERVIFTNNCTQAINIALFGILKKGMKVVTTVFEHNSVLRPLYKMQKDGIIELKIVTPSDIELMENEILIESQNADVVVMTGASNVTGKVFDISFIGNALKNSGKIFIVDGAQICGHEKIDMLEYGIDVLCVSGHKGMYGIMGSGALLFTKDIEIEPFVYGGTGSESELQQMPSVYPERLEAGTLPLPAIVSLYEGTLYVGENTEYIGETLKKYTRDLIYKLNILNGITVFSEPNSVGIVSFVVEGYDSSVIADMLDEKYDIAVRSGLFCSPLTHAYYGTANSGMIRVSLSIENTISEINAFIKALSSMI